MIPVQFGAILRPTAKAPDDQAAQKWSAVRYVTFANMRHDKNAFHAQGTGQDTFAVLSPEAAALAKVVDEHPKLMQFQLDFAADTKALRLKMAARDNLLTKKYKLENEAAQLQTVLDAVTAVDPKTCQQKTSLDDQALIASLQAADRFRQISEELAALADGTTRQRLDREIQSLHIRIQESQREERLCRQQVVQEFLDQATIHDVPYWPGGQEEPPMGMDELLPRAKTISSSKTSLDAQRPTGFQRVTPASDTSPAISSPEEPTAPPATSSEDTSPLAPWIKRLLRF